MNTHVPAGLLDHIDHRLLWKCSGVVKDKDKPTLNTVTTDTVVTVGEKIAVTDCIAHTHMHTQKHAPGNLVRYSTMRLKNMRERVRERERDRERERERERERDRHTDNRQTKTDKVSFSVNLY